MTNHTEGYTPEELERLERIRIQFDNDASTAEQKYKDDLARIRQQYEDDLELKAHGGFIINHPETGVSREFVGVQFTKLPSTLPDKFKFSFSFYTNKPMVPSEIETIYREQFPGIDITVQTDEKVGFIATCEIPREWVSANE